MGHQLGEQATLFYEFSLERHVPPDHPFRSIDRFVDLDGLRRELAPFCSAIGRPSIAPELMIRMLWSVTASASARSGVCAKKFTSTWHTAGSAALGSTVTYPTIRPSRRTGMVASAIVICCDGCSRPSCDPAARWTGAHGGQTYSTNYLIDVDNAIIVHDEPTTAIRQAEVLAAKRIRADREELRPPPVQASR